MLLDTDKSYVIEALVKAVSSLQKPREVLLSAFKDTPLGEELSFGQPRDLVIQIVQICLNNGWKNEPTWLERLLVSQSLIDNDPKISEIWERSKNKPPDTGNPLEETVINNVIPFLNRSALRQQINKLSTTAADMQPILIVDGVDKSGKSYSEIFIDHFISVGKTSNKLIIKCKLEFKAEVGLEMGAAEVAQDLVSQMGHSLETMPKPVTNMKLYAKQLASWVLNQAAQTTRQHWFVLDNFKGENLRQDTRDFIIALIDTVTIGVFQERCRLILIGPDRTLLTVEPGKVDEEFIGKCKDTHIESGIKDILKRTKAVIAFDKVSTYVLTGLPNTVDKMKVLNNRLRRLLYVINQLNFLLADDPEFELEVLLMKMLEDLPENQKEAMDELKERLAELTESINEPD